MRSLLLALALATTLSAEPLTLNLWPGQPPGPAAKTDGPERDMTKPGEKQVAGKHVTRLGHVATPQAHVFLPAKEKANGAAVIICPGGGYNILAWNLEGTEVAEWLNTLGYAAIVVKYRVPTGHHGDAMNAAGNTPLKAEGPVMDAQRAIALTRGKAAEWNLDPARIGILGFSAGGATAGIAALHGDTALYEKAPGEASCAPAFALLIYPAYFVERDGALKPWVKVTAATPPMFFAMSQDDPVNCENCTALFIALKRAKVPAELHLWPTGGHGYGLRETAQPITRWPVQAAEWLRTFAGAAKK